MPDSATESVLIALSDALQAISGLAVLRNPGAPVEVPDGGRLAVIRDGTPGEPERVLGGFAAVYYTHDVTVEVFVRAGDDAGRDALYDGLLQDIGAALSADPTLGGLVYGLTSAMPRPQTEETAGAPAVKAATITITVEYQVPGQIG